MAASVSAINILFGLNSIPFDKGIRGIQGKLKGLDSSLLSLRAAFTGISIGAGIGWAVKIAAGAETAITQMEVLLGSAEKAREMLKDLRALDIKSPFDMTQLSATARLLLQMGVASEKVIPILARMATIAGTDSERLNRLAYAFGQITATGRLMGQDLKQLTEAGFNPLLEISRITGRSMDELRKQMEDGRISAELVGLAFESATGPGGRFEGMLDKLSQTTEGRFAKLLGATRMLAMELGNSLLPSVNKLIAAARLVVDWFATWDIRTLKLTAQIFAFSIVVVGAVQVVSALIPVIRSLAIAMKALYIAQMAVNGALGGFWGSLITGTATLVTVGLIIDGIKELDESAKKSSKSVQKLLDDIDKKLKPKSLIEMRAEMEAQLNLGKGAEDLVDGMKSFNRALENLRPAGMLKGSADAESTINRERFPRPKIMDPLLGELKAGNALARNANALLRRISEGQQPVLPAVLG